MENKNLELVVGTLELEIEVGIGIGNWKSKFKFKSEFYILNWKSELKIRNWQLESDMCIMHVIGEDWKLKVGIENQNLKLSWKFGMENGRGD